MFCIVKNFESLGHGKVIEQTAINCQVEYFYSPYEVKRHVKTVPVTDVIKCSLGENSRIYHYDEISNEWSVGRVKNDIDDELLVRFSDGVDSFCDSSEVFVRCKRSIDDSTAYLAQCITETPQYAESRRSFLASYIRQRGVSWGISALLSSVIELEPHQISVVRRILNDPTQRYLLADEVGLGKTIEAGLIIRQAVLDAPKNHHIVILAPNTLIHQWREELTLRFGLMDFLDISVLVIAQDESLVEIDNQLKNATMLVIDEAHHVAGEAMDRFVQLYDCLRLRVPSIDRLLLLSATPVLRNETGFLRMLHLLDPVMYSLDDIERFRDKIKHRQILAESVAMLNPENSLFLDGVLDELLSKLPCDDRLHELICQLRPFLLGIPDENNPALVESITQLRAHLSETYRLHRRILRNRRKHVENVTPDRAGGTLVAVQQTQIGNIESLIEAWRVDASLDEARQSVKGVKVFGEFYWELLSSLFSNPSRIQILCDERIEAIKKSSAISFQGEEAHLKELASIVDPDAWVSSRIDQLEILIKDYIVSRSKLVVFCSDPIIADMVYERLLCSYQNAIVRQTSPAEVDNIGAAPAVQFINQDAVRIIVCDHTAEEGLNLQGKRKIIIHFDLPIEPNRIEQRMGRVDRYGAGDPVKSFILFDEGSKYQYQWYSLIADALGVFDRSISSLQYLVESELQSLIESVFAEGIDALIALTNRLVGPKGAVAEELKLIDEQDALDELMPLAEVDFGDIFDVDDDWKEIRRATTYWSTETLLFQEICEPLGVSNPPIDPPFRFCYKVPGHGGTATLIAFTGFLEDFIGAIDYSYNRPISYAHCARRQTAVRHNCRLLRYGDEFVEALKSFADNDDRGRSYALWRQMRDDYVEIEPKVYFSFDFLVETNLSEAEAELEQFHIFTDTSRAAIRRRGDSLFAPFVDRIWIDENGVEPSVDFVERFLELPYDKNGTNPRYVDTNLKSTRFRKLIKSSPDTFANWDLLCIRMRDTAQTAFLKRKRLANLIMVALDRARAEDELRHAQMWTRIQSLRGREADLERNQLAIEQGINKGLYRGIDSPSVKIDVAGLVLLTATPYQKFYE